MSRAASDLSSVDAPAGLRTRLVVGDVESERTRVLQRISGQTLCHAFLRTAARKRDDVSVRVLGDDRRQLTWGEYEQRVGAVAAGLAEVGVRPGDAIALLMGNCVEFHVVDMAAMFLGAVPFSIYVSSSPEQIRYVLDHSGASVVVVGNSELFVRVCAALGAGARRPTIVCAFGGDATKPGDSLGLDQLASAGQADLDHLADRIALSDPATFIYTSGTTGKPKGVVLSHRNVRYAGEVYTERMGVDFDGLRTVSYLPMAHIAERQATHYFHMTKGSEVTICPDLSRLGEALLVVRPQWWFCAPRFWEKLRSQIEAPLVGDEAARLRFAAARRLGAEVHELRRSGRDPDVRLEEEWSTARRDTIVPHLESVGLDQVEIANSGSASMSADTLEFFIGCGLPLSDGYGLSETSGIATWDPGQRVPGTSGYPYPGVEIELGSDGEVKIRAPLVFAGYLEDPDRTAEAIDAKGWLCTGDIGQIVDGALRIIDRKKEIIVPTSGHNISPAMLEGLLVESPLIAQACVVGDGRPFPAALIVPDAMVARAWREANAEPGGDASLAATDPVLEEIERHVRGVNERVAGPERVRAYRVVADEWTPDSEFLTPTAKLKRRSVAAVYAELIDEMYATAAVSS